MDSVRRSRFQSKQLKAGPAPLASFEDLPSDELESPEDFESRGYICSIDDDSSRDLQFTTPDSLTISSQSTPRIDSDFESQFTLTPGGDSYQGQSTSDLRTASLSSLSKEDSLILNVKQKKGSAASLNTLEATEVDYTHRKSSWTDIFKSHNQNSAKNSTSVSSQLDSGVKSSKKKSKTDTSKHDSETKSKEKNKFLSLFKKKSNKSAPVSPDSYILPTESLNIREFSIDIDPVVQNKLTNGKVSKGKENESPIQEVSSSVMTSENQNDLGKSNSENCDKIPDERKINRKLINISENAVEKEYNILMKQVEDQNIDLTPKIEEVQPIVEAKDDLESSESDLTLESKDISIEKKEDDFEAEILLPHDLSEIEEEPVSELQPISFEMSQVSIPSRQQRLEITTKPIERPRSTTPINVAPLEAFIQSVSPTFNSKINKIKLSLPGEQFIGRSKSPKKTSIKSWADFCERGLHSPRMHRRFDKDSLKGPFQSSDDILSFRDVQYPSEGNWAAFESDFGNVDLNVFGDTFKSDFGSSCNTTTSELAQTLPESYQYFESDFSSSEFMVLECTCPKADSYELSNAQSSAQNCDENCSCQCHSKQLSTIYSSELHSNIDTFGASDNFNLITKEQL